MRVLLTTWAWPSHLYALVPIAWAFRAAGHRVLVASQPGLTDEILRCGLPAAQVGKDVDTVGFIRNYVLGAVPQTAGAPPNGLPAARRGPRALEMVQAHAESMLDDLIATARGFRPDLIISEPTTLAGPLAAAVLDTPAVRWLYGTDLMLRADSVLPGLLEPLAQRYGVRSVCPYGAVTVDPVPPSLRLPTDRLTLSARYLPFNGSHASVELRPRTRPRVCVTWGHTMAKISSRLFLLPAVVSALQKLHIEVVAAVSAAQAPLLGPVPDNVRVVVDAPLNQLVSSCDLVVAHGGAGTVLTALYHGVPLLMVPQLPDHAGHAGRVAAVGAGELVPIADADGEHLREQVQRLLAEEQFRRRAWQLRAEIHEQPPPSELVADLLRFAA